MEAVALQERKEPAQEGLQQRLDLGVLRRRQRVEGAVIGEDALGDEHVEDTGPPLSGSPATPVIHVDRGLTLLVRH